MLHVCRVLTVMATVFVLTGFAAAQQGTPQPPPPDQQQIPPAEPPADPPAEPPAAVADVIVVEGELLSVDTDLKTITVKVDPDTQMTFSYTDETEVAGAEGGVAGLATSGGSLVTVHYTEEAEIRTATRIEVKVETP